MAVKREHAQLQGFGVAQLWVQLANFIQNLDLEKTRGGAALTGA